MEENGTKIKYEHRLTTLEKDVEYIKKTQDSNHAEVMRAFEDLKENHFQPLKEKVNEEITTMGETLIANKRFLIKLIIIAFAVGSFIWIKESRDWILANILRF